MFLLFFTLLLLFGAAVVIIGLLRVAAIFKFLYISVLDVVVVILRLALAVLR